ncbi:helix-turn-helix domain-containing protein [Streptomyces nitrosporeus]|uniref:citrate synthase (unknown stereospecificity) n=1 Tax=Streptomyces nitrosporeus TaxID=28894 RepID=A0A5J6F6B1_9ACTN|nr:citrate synthase [Streptomyces nitrosporeus]QEU71839.1 helix-turn-helix domain-containing protein [Streptomyces nitrosporeus]GGY93810.1 citrate synthase [Streptomyces nitrosporeus]
MTLDAAQGPGPERSAGTAPGPVPGTAQGPVSGTAPGPGTTASAPPAAHRLTTRETAELLGVKPETVYAYVSRGQLSSRRAPGTRGSTFDAAEVRALARRTGRREQQAASAAGEPAIRTGLTLIEHDRYHFRGVDATELARRYGYEEVAEWLWTGELRAGTRFTAPEESLAAARRTVATLPEHSDSADRLRVAVVAAAAMDPLRFDLSPDGVLNSARGLIPTMVGALPPAGGAPRGQAEGGGQDGSLATRLWPRLSALPADAPSLAVLDTALALLADHDLATSTLAARVAASAHAHPYAVVLAGLGVLEGPLHGAASGLAHRMLTEAVARGSAAPVVADHLRAGRRVPGLGHRLYTGEDPRATALLGLLARVPRAAAALEAARDVVATTARHAPLHANVDLALAVLSVSCGMPADAGETVFAVSRTAGWIAHALEEYAERPLRMRPSGQYDGPVPPRPVPGPGDRAGDGAAG